MRSASGPLRDDPRSPAAVPAAITWLARVALIGLLLGGLATWPLWTGGQTFPQIPWFGWATRIPTFVDRLFLVGCGTAAISLLIAPQRVRTSMRVLLSVSAVALVTLDQHRLQVWVLHLLGVLWLLWLSPNARGLTLVRAFVISIYVHSALSRFDRASLEMQWELLAPLLERIGATMRFVAESRRLSAGAAFAGWELAVAILLAIPRTRRVGLWGSIGMHAALLLILGPLGQKHHAGVLVWNAVWIAQNLVLFGGTSRQEERETASVAGRGSAWGGRWAMVVAAVLIAAPLLEPWGWWDHWPSWRVYSARPETVACYIESGRVDALPEHVRRYVGPPEPLSDWRALNLDAWSFEELRCPVYPQGRFRLGVALAVAREFEPGDAVCVVIGSPPDRWTGERTMTELRGERTIEDACGRFAMNTSRRDAR